MSGNWRVSFSRPLFLEEGKIILGVFCSFLPVLPCPFEGLSVETLAILPDAGGKTNRVLQEFLWTEHGPFRQSLVCHVEAFKILLHLKKHIYWSCLELYNETMAYYF